jgi:ATP-dependent RNA helicase HelY
LAALTVRPPRPSRRRVDPEAEAKADELERQARQHPCHSCPDRAKHERWALRASKLERDVAGLERRIRARTETLGRQFDRVISVLEELGYVRDFLLTEKGERLRRIYGEGDILVTEALWRGLLDAVSPPELAAIVSAFVYESRERASRRAELPTQALRRRARALHDLWLTVRRHEDAHQVELCRELDFGFAFTVFEWAEGKPLEDVLTASGMAAGDFVRNCKQLLDLLRQIEEVAEGDGRGSARAAHDAVNRSVVAYTGVDV